MRNLVCSAQQNKTKQFTLELEWDKLKTQMEQLEKLIVAEKSKISQIYPTISASHKDILKGRTKCIQLSSYCLKIGKNIKGPEYK